MFCFSLNRKYPLQGQVLKACFLGGGAFRELMRPIRDKIKLQSLGMGLWRLYWVSRSCLVIYFQIFHGVNNLCPTPRIWAAAMSFSPWWTQALKPWTKSHQFQVSSLRYGIFGNAKIPNKLTIKYLSRSQETKIMCGLISEHHRNKLEINNRMLKMKYLEIK